MRTLILGGGFGGLATATKLRGRLGAEHEIVVVDRREHFVMGFRKLWALVGIEGGLEAGTRSRSALATRGIQWLPAAIGAIDARERSVETDRGRLTADHLVVALGAESRPDLVPGLGEHGVDLYDPSAIPDAARRVASLQEGRVSVSIAGVPYRCPPAPYEAVMLLEEHFRRRGVREEVAMTFTTFQPALLPNAGRPGHEWVAGQLATRGITFEVGRAVKRVAEGRIVFDDGDLVSDLGFVVPPHRPPPVVKESGLTGDGEWIRVDARTLATEFPGVWAIGDCTTVPLAGGAALPKAGLFAEAHGLRVAAAIAAEIRGEPEPPPFDGHGACFLEVGSEEAALLEGDFFAEGGPEVRVVGATREHAAAKRRFEEDRLEAWFGSP